MPRIEVTLEDIRNGWRSNSSYCPLALALKRALNRDDIHVVYGEIYIGRSVFRTSQELEDFMIYFDMGLEVKPFGFDWESLELVDRR